MGQFYRVKNLTPHQIRILVGGGVFTFDPTEMCARIVVKEEKADNMMGIPVSVVSYGEVLELPEPEVGTALIVSQMVAQARPERDDLFFPLTLIRDVQTHKVLGAMRLGRTRKEGR